MVVATIKYVRFPAICDSLTVGAREELMLHYWQMSISTTEMITIADSAPSADVWSLVMVLWARPVC